MENIERKLKIEYGKKLLKSEVPKLLILILFFISVSKFKEFIFALLVLLPLRLYTGGLHFKSSKVCFFFSFFFFALIIFILSDVMLSNYFEITIVSTILFICLSPVRNSKRPYGDAHYIRLKKCSSCLCLIMVLFILFLLKSKFYLFGIIGFWIFTLQTLQLVIAAVIYKER